jgi:uncharacterized protein
MSDPADTLSGMGSEVLSWDEVRRITLRAQGFTGAAGRRGGVLGVLNQVAAVQLDTISVLARSHELVAYARLGAVPRQRIEQAYWHPGKPTAFEYWAHAACILPLAEWPYYAFRRRKFRAQGQRWHKVSQTACDEVRARLAADGPLNATELGGAKGGGPWWDWSEVKIAAEWLLDLGEVVCVRRNGWRRIYDLPERVLPAELLDHEPTDLDCLAHLIGVSARALGVVTRADVVDYHRLSSFLTAAFGAGQAASGAALAAAAEAADLVPVSITGTAGGKTTPGWADPAALAQLAAASRERQRVTLLSPFDSLVWDRKRTLRLFGFEHSLEAYVPKEKRVHGYFTMPLLAGGRLAGRVDPAREGTTLVARKVTVDRASAVEPMARALREAATWVGCHDVRVEQVAPAAYAPRLAAALAGNAG